MSQHSPKLHPVPSLALAPVEIARERSAVAVRSALAACPAGVVAHRLRCSEDLVRRWGRGQGSPSLAQILQAPERFALRLIAAAGEVYLPPVAVCEVPPRERLWLLAAALGALIAATPTESPAWSNSTTRSSRSATASSPTSRSTRAASAPPSPGSARPNAAGRCPVSGKRLVLVAIETLGGGL